MGCGASALSIPSGQPDQRIIPNGYPSKATSNGNIKSFSISRFKHNSVSPGIIDASSDGDANNNYTEVKRETSTLGQASKRISQRRLSSIHETVFEYKTASIQTDDSDLIHGLKSQLVQTDLDFFQEDVEFNEDLLNDYHLAAKSHQEDDFDGSSHFECRNCPSCHPPSVIEAWDVNQASVYDKPPILQLMGNFIRHVWTQTDSKVLLSRSVQTTISFSTCSPRITTTLVSRPTSSLPPVDEIESMVKPESSSTSFLEVGNNNSLSASLRVRCDSISAISDVGSIDIPSPPDVEPNSLLPHFRSLDPTPDTLRQELEVLGDLEASELVVPTFLEEVSPKNEGCKDVSVQTEMAPLASLIPRPPTSRKKEMIPTTGMFQEVDKRAVECPKIDWPSEESLVQYLTQDLPNELFRVRVIFRWISQNIRFDGKHSAETLTPIQIITNQEGVTKDFCSLFSCMCRIAGIQVRSIRGFVKGHDYKPGHFFTPGVHDTHEWNCVFILGSWRHIDVTLGSGYIDHSGSFVPKFNEHFFLPDPEVFSWTHLPFDPHDESCDSWQLLEEPIKLDDFNSRPKVSPHFFNYNLKIRSKYSNPISFKIQTEIKMASHEAMRYKFKLFSADEAENTSLNHYVFCQLREERLVGCFMVTPPLESRFYFKIFAKPEREMLEGTDNSSLPFVTCFLLDCQRARRYLEPYPLNELPWGVTQAFFDFKMKLINQTGPVISTWGGKRKVILETADSMLLTHQMLDSDGMEMDIRTYILKEETGNRLTFTIAPPRVGKFKFSLFGMPKPKQRGKWRLPLLATFLVDCKLAKLPLPDDDPSPNNFVARRKSSCVR